MKALSAYFAKQYTEVVVKINLEFYCHSLELNFYDHQRNYEKHIPKYFPKKTTTVVFFAFFHSKHLIYSNCLTQTQLSGSNSFILTVHVKCRFCVAVGSKRKNVVCWIVSAISVVYSYVVGRSREDGMVQCVTFSKLMCVYSPDDPFPMKNREILRLNA